MLEPTTESLKQTFLALFAAWTFCCFVGNLFPKIEKKIGQKSAKGGITYIPLAWSHNTLGGNTS